MELRALDGLSKDHSSCAVQYVLKFVKELLVAASEKNSIASGKLVDVNRERQVGIEQHTEITNAGRQLYGSAGW